MKSWIVRDYFSILIWILYFIVAKWEYFRPWSGGCPLLFSQVNPGAGSWLGDSGLRHAAGVGRRGPSSLVNIAQEPGWSLVIPATLCHILPQRNVAKTLNRIYGTVVGPNWPTSLAWRRTRMNKSVFWYLNSNFVGLIWSLVTLMLTQITWC